MLTRLDATLLLVNFKISYCLNWVTGKTPESFFKPCVFATWPLITAYCTIEDGRITTNGWTVIAVAFWPVIMIDSYMVKRNLLAGVASLHSARFHRVIWILLLIFPATRLPALEVLFGITGYLLTTYSRYCYLYDIPPRDSIFARAKKKIKAMLPSLTPAPSPA